MNNLRSKIIPLAIIVVLFIVLLGLFIVSMTTKRPASEQPGPTIQPSPSQKIVPPDIDLVPTIPIEQGGGIDENSTVIKSSTAEIKKLYSNLPYVSNFVSSSGVDISIVIPEESLQTNTWTLTAQVFGINYNTSPDQSDYESMKKSFQEASGVVFSWIRQNNADPEKIIFTWGDREFIQDQAETWLK